MNRTETALNYFDKGFNCAQAVVGAFINDLNIDEEIALKVSSAFGGGIAGLQEICGVLTGASMVVGLKYGKYQEGDDEAKAKTMKTAKELIMNFEKKYNAIRCIDILGYDMKTEDGQKNIKDKDLFNTKCRKCIQDIVNDLEKIL